jgi:hypothetical protein
MRPAQYDQKIVFLGRLMIEPWFMNAVGSQG